jgi:hypothetical protein
LIPAEIVARLEKSELVLCDISSLNPNVFMELGIRTALNKPVAMVKDNLTVRIPFDTATIGHHTYDESLTPWTLASQITKLSEHIEQVRNSGPENAMWKYFGMRLQAGAPSADVGVDERLDFIMQQLEEMGARDHDRLSSNLLSADTSPVADLHAYLNRALGNVFKGMTIEGNQASVKVSRALSARGHKALVRSVKDSYGFDLLISPSDAT